MALLACRCLNVELSTAEEPRPLESRKPPTDFSQKVGVVGSCSVRVSSPTLASSRERDEWRVFECLLCGSRTHAQSPTLTLLNLELLSDERTVADLKNRENYSPTFKVLLDTPSVQFDADGRESPLVSHPAARDLHDHLTEQLKSKMIAINAEVVQFQEMKSSEYMAFRKRAMLEYNTISSVLSRIENLPSFQEENKKNIVIKNSENVIFSNYSPNIKKSTSYATQMSVNKPKRTMKNFINVGSYQEDSLDSEGIFDLEGMDSSMSPHNGHNSDTYDSDTEDSVSRDEGIVIRNSSAHQVKEVDFAKSLPVNIPTFGPFHEHSRDKREQNVEDPHDIAASMKALARSVHEDVFGDLPRPRFSTQI